MGTTWIWSTSTIKWNIHGKTVVNLMGSWLWVPQTEHNYYWCSRNNAPTTTSETTKLFSCMTLLAHMLHCRSKPTWKHSVGKLKIDTRNIIKKYLYFKLLVSAQVTVTMRNHHKINTTSKNRCYFNIFLVFLIGNKDRFWNNFSDKQWNNKNSLHVSNINFTNTNQSSLHLKTQNSSVTI